MMMNNKNNFLNKIIKPKDYFEEMKKHKNIVCWGAGAKGIQTLKLLQKEGIQPVAFIDKNVYDTEEKEINGIRVISYSQLKKSFETYCIVITTVWQNAKEILNSLVEEKNPVYVCANPFKMETKFYSWNELQQMEEELCLTYELLADDLSKKIMVGFINWKITGDSTQSAIFTDDKSELEWFDFDKLLFDKNYTYVDIGAFTGDTIIRFMAFSKWQYKKIIAVEPDTTNLNIMKKCFSYLRMEDKEIDIRNIGVWNERKELKFFSSGEDVYESSNFIQDCKNTISIDRRKKHGIGKSELLQVDMLDNILKGEKNPLLIKIDVQGSEYEALQGAEYIIKDKQPILIMEFGTHSKHIADIVPMLKEWNTNYKFYLRQKILSSNSRTVLYVI